MMILRSTATAISREIQQSSWLVFLFVALVSSIPFLTVINEGVHGDVQLYERVGDQIEDGMVPYRDTVLEYPPYAIVVFWLPRLICGEAIDYQRAFALAVLAADFFIKLILFTLGAQEKGLKRFLPLVLYSAVVPLWCFWFVQRYDIFPALMALVAVVLFWEKRYASAGLLLAFAGGVKLYPFLIVPSLWILATKQKGGTRFAAGVIFGLLPILALSFFMPWWRFAAFHGARGLQAESLYASLLWFSNHLGWVDVRWSGVKAWLDITGPAADALLPWAKILFAAYTLLGIVLSVLAASRMASPSLAATARLALFPILGFVAFNQVLSPQYLLWLLPLAALATIDEKPGLMFALVWAGFLTPIFYPAPDYGSGLNFYRTFALVVRNICLVTVFLLLAVEYWSQVRFVAKSSENLPEPSRLPELP